MRTLPIPSLEKHERLGIGLYTDDALFDVTGIRIAFTCSNGGYSSGDFEGLDLATHVGDDPADVERNRSLVMEALGAPSGMAIGTLDQVHGSDVLFLGEGREPEPDADLLMAPPSAEADAIVVGPRTRGIAAMLHYADCVPVAVASPSGSFAVIHSGWRGVIVRNAATAVERLLAEDPDARVDDLVAYIGPCIRRECFEVDAELSERFAAEFGEDVVHLDRNVDLPLAVRMSLEDIGIQPSCICDMGICTACSEGEFYSYRASGGRCGRHAAIGFRDLSRER